MCIKNTYKFAWKLEPNYCMQSLYAKRRCAPGQNPGKSKQVDRRTMLLLLTFSLPSISSTASPLHPKLPNTPHIWDLAFSLRSTAPRVVATCHHAPYSQEK